MAKGNYVREFIEMLSSANMSDVTLKCITYTGIKTECLSSLKCINLYLTKV